MRLEPRSPEGRSFPRRLVSLSATWVTLVGLLAAISPASAAALSAAQEVQAGRLDQTFLAPCCYSQTLDIHDSEAATEMRKAIRELLAEGKSPVEIKQMAVKTYGEKILAIPTGSILPKLLTYTGVAVLLAGLLMVVLGKRWVKRSQARLRATEASAEGRLEGPQVLTERDLLYLELLEDELSYMHVES